jgi:hypothetical protein
MANEFSGGRVRTSGSTMLAVQEFFGTERRNGDRIQKLNLGLSEDDELPPYVYQEFPKALYGPDGETALARNAEEEQAKLREGYFPTLEAALAAEEAASSYTGEEEAPETPSERARRAAHARWGKK